jgi:hypothetical protein
MFVFLCFSIMDQIWGHGKGKISRLLTGWYKFFFGGFGIAEHRKKVWMFIWVMVTATG